MANLSDLTSQCIRCGFCLESCPTFMMSGNEVESPRGRIYLAKSAAAGDIAWDATAAALDTCLGCRACETACPSGVQYGEILELARAEVRKGDRRPWMERLLQVTTRPAMLRANLMLGELLPSGPMPKFLSGNLSDEPAQADRPRVPSPTPWPELDEAELPAVRGEVYLLEGCAMRVLYPDVNEATRRLLRRAGFRVRETSAGCCGALHAHSGYLREADELATGLAKAMPDDLPVIVNSAGCGSTIKDYGAVVGAGLEGFASRAVDIAEFLAGVDFEQQLAASSGLPGVRLTYHDACHLVHGQRVASAPRRLLEAIPGVELVPLLEADVCCGSAGTYNLTQPSRARKLLDRKWDNVAATGAQIVVMGNPGCQTWIGQAARESGECIEVRHTADVLESSFSGLRRLG